MAKRGPSPQGRANKIYDGRIERTSKSRTFVAPKRPQLDDCKVTYTDDAERTVKFPERNPKRVVRWKGKSHYVPSTIAGATNYRRAK